MPSPNQIDVLIPAIEKDLINLPYVIDHVRAMVVHPIRDIYIVAPKIEGIERLCRQKACKFVDETTVLPIAKKQIHYRSKHWDRSGWLFQQLLKLNGDSICSCSRYLVIDADTLLIRKHVFFSGSKRVMYYREWSRPEYFRAYEKLLGNKPSSPVSFVAHYMLFEKRILKQLKTAVEARHHMPWYIAILQNINKSSAFAFSEFETYANFLYSRYPETFIFRKVLNRSLPANAKNVPKMQIKKLAQSYRSLSFHKRKGYFLPLK